MCIIYIAFYWIHNGPLSGMSRLCYRSHLTRIKRSIFILCNSFFGWLTCKSFRCVSECRIFSKLNMGFIQFCDWCSESIRVHGTVRTGPACICPIGRFFLWTDLVISFVIHLWMKIYQVKDWFQRFLTWACHVALHHLLAWRLTCGDLIDGTFARRTTPVKRKLLFYITYTHITNRKNIEMKKEIECKFKNNFN